MTKEQKLYELSKELVYQMTGNYTEDTQDADFQIAWTYLNKAMDFIHCCTQLKDKQELTFDEWIKENNYRKVYKGYARNQIHFGDAEMLQRYNYYKRNL